MSPCGTHLICDPKDDRLSLMTAISIALRSSALVPALLRVRTSKTDLASTTETDDTPSLREQSRGRTREKGAWLRCQSGLLTSLKRRSLHIISSQ
eukprot:3879330-Pyramimonas_sp.AAC.1